VLDGHGVAPASPHQRGKDGKVKAARGLPELGRGVAEHLEPAASADLEQFAEHLAKVSDVRRHGIGVLVGIPHDAHGLVIVRHHA
jgi:hypothetical protein